MTKAHNHAGSVRSNVARVGLIGKGVLYALLGLLAINVAAGNRASADKTSKTGAIQTVAEAPYGKFLLIALTAVLIALVVWKISQAISGDPIDGSDPSDRAKFAFKALIYGVAALTSLSILIANWGGPGGAAPTGGGGGDESKKQATGMVMGLPGGRWIIMLVGLVAIGVGGYKIYKHTFNCGFMKRFESLEQSKRKTVETLGRAGYAGSGVVTTGIGFFLFIAGLTFDPNNVKGLSGLLAELAGNGWGQILLWLIAFGLFAYGLFTFAEARYRRAT